MDTSDSPQLDSSLNDSVTDGEENHSETSPSPAAPPQVSEDSPGVTDGQKVQVQRVIKAPQTSVIQSPQAQTVQIATVAELEEDESVADTQKRRVLLSRRPSYRKILNELSSDSPTVPKIDEEKTEEEEPVSIAPSPSASIYQTSSGQYYEVAIAQGRVIQLTSNGAEALQGAQTMTVDRSPTPQTGATFLQCAAQPEDSPQQFYIQGGQVLIKGRVQLIWVKLNVYMSRKCGMV